MKTEAHRFDRNSESGWLINGEKMWTTIARRATIFLFSLYKCKRGDLWDKLFVMPLMLLDSVSMNGYGPSICYRSSTVSLKDVWLPDGQYSEKSIRSMLRTAYTRTEYVRPLLVWEQRFAFDSVDYANERITWKI